jgi:hypothetical protein
MRGFPTAETQKSGEREEVFGSTHMSADGILDEEAWSSSCGALWEEPRGCGVGVGRGGVGLEEVFGSGRMITEVSLNEEA